MYITFYNSLCSLFYNLLATFIRLLIGRRVGERMVANAGLIKNLPHNWVIENVCDNNSGYVCAATLCAATLCAATLCTCLPAFLKANWPKMRSHLCFAFIAQKAFCLSQMNCSKWPKSLKTPNPLPHKKHRFLCLKSRYPRMNEIFGIWHSRRFWVDLLWIVLIMHEIGLRNPACKSIYIDYMAWLYIL